jgi:predicted tellurium resistance membrane protein TerC
VFDLSATLAVFQDPQNWLALITLIVMEVVLGIDNLIFISILTNKLPAEIRQKARIIGISGALIMRLALLSTIFLIVKLTYPVISFLGVNLSWRDIILIAGGLFLIWKATSEIHHKLEGHEETGPEVRAGIGFGGAVFQILLIDLVFSLDSIITAVGMTNHIVLMVIAVLVSILVMLVAAGPLSEFINRHPTIVMLALAFLLMIGMILVAEGFGAHVPKGYVYAAMAFSALVEALNMWARRRSAKRETPTS